jgi:hypothetical protein
VPSNGLPPRITSLSIRTNPDSGNNVERSRITDL